MRHALAELLICLRADTLLAMLTCCRYCALRRAFVKDGAQRVYARRAFTRMMHAIQPRCCRVYACRHILLFTCCCRFDIPCLRYAADVADIRAHRVLRYA